MKIGLVITSPIYIRNYINHQFLRDCEDADLVLLTRDSVKFAEEPGFPLERYSIGKIQAFLSAVVFKVFLLKKLGTSKTFAFRLLRAIGWDTAVSSWGTFLERGAAGNCLQTAVAAMDCFGALFFCAAKTAIHCLLTPLLIIPRATYAALLAIHAGDLEKVLLTKDLDVLIFPFSGYEFEQNFLPGIAKKGGFKLIYCTDNWDNLSSKTVLVEFPDVVTVWGEQTRRHAIEIQGIPSDRVVVAPSPRLAVYLNMADRHIHTRTIGFVGAFLAFDEVKSLEVLEEVLCEHESRTGEIWKILYRPHPWRMAKSEVDRLSVLRRTSLVEEFEAVYKRNGWSVDFQPKLDGYVDFFGACDFVVGGMTTMLIEAMLAQRPVVAIGFWDNKYNLLSPGSALKNYEHFVGLEKLRNLRIARSEVELSLLVQEQLVSSAQYVRDPQLSYFVKADDVLQLKRLLQRLGYAGPAHVQVRSRSN